MLGFVMDNLPKRFLWRSGSNYGPLDCRQVYTVEKQKSENDLIENVLVCLPYSIARVGHWVNQTVIIV